MTPTEIRNHVKSIRALATEITQNISDLHDVYEVERLAREIEAEAGSIIAAMQGEGIITRPQAR